MNTTIQSTLLDLMQQVIEDPDHIPIIPLDVWSEGTEQQHLLTGMLVLTSKEENAFTQHHGALTLAIANQAAIAIENARLYEQAQELAAVEERQRLARELHDSVSQALGDINAYRLVRRAEFPTQDQTRTLPCRARGSAQYDQACPCQHNTSEAEPDTRSGHIGGAGRWSGF